jgi:hypothetical protein
MAKSRKTASTLVPYWWRKMKVYRPHPGFLTSAKTARLWFRVYGLDVENHICNNPTKDNPIVRWEAEVKYPKEPSIRGITTRVFRDAHTALEDAYRQCVRKLEQHEKEAQREVERWARCKNHLL